MAWPKPDRLRRGALLLLGLALAPKCLACVAAWLGLAALLGLGPEICGGP